MTTARTPVTVPIRVLLVAIVLLIAALTASCTSEQGSQVTTDGGNQTHTTRPDPDSDIGGAEEIAGSGTDGAAGTVSDGDGVDGVDGVGSAGGVISERSGDDGVQITLPADVEQARQAARVPDISPPTVADTTGSQGPETPNSESGADSAAGAGSSGAGVITQGGNNTGTQSTTHTDTDARTNPQRDKTSDSDPATSTDKTGDTAKGDNSASSKSKDTSSAEGDSSAEDNSAAGGTGGVDNASGSRSSEADSSSGRDSNRGSGSDSGSVTTRSEPDVGLERAFEILRSKKEASPTPTSVPEFKALEVESDTAAEVEIATMDFDPCHGLDGCDPQNPFVQPEPTAVEPQVEVTQIEPDKCHEDPRECDDAAQEIVGGQLTLVPGKKAEPKVYDPDDPICETQWWQPGCVGYMPTPEAKRVDEHGRQLPNQNITSKIKISDATLADLLTPGDNETGSTQSSGSAKSETKSAAVSAESETEPTKKDDS